MICIPTRMYSFSDRSQVDECTTSSLIEAALLPDHLPGRDGLVLPDGSHLGVLKESDAQCLSLPGSAIQP